METTRNTHTKRNIAARAGRWSARHRKTAIVGWLAFVIAAVFIGGAIGMKELKQSEYGTGDSGRADAVLADSFKQNYSERVLIQVQDGSVRDAKGEAAIRDVVDRIEATGKATAIVSPLSSDGAGQVSKEGRSALVSYEIKGTAGDDEGELLDRVDPLLAATAAAQKAHPGVRVEQIGDASIAKAFEKAMTDDFAKATTMSLPITLFILVIAFGALVAAGIPVLIAITGVMATVSLVAIPSQIAAVDPAITEVILLVGMAVGVDYSLFYLRREREERAAGKDAEAALEAAAATSGRSVLISGLTVIVAMAGMYFTGDKTFSSFATGTIMVVAVAMIASLTVLPALLSLLGDKVMKGRVPFLAKHRENQGESRMWNAILGPVLRHPKIAAIASAALLVALALPAIGLKTGNPGADGLPQDLPVSKTFDRMDKAFPGGELPATVVVQAQSVRSPEVSSAINDLRSQALETGEFNEPARVDVSPSGTVAVLSLPIAGSGTDDRSNAALFLIIRRVGRGENPSS
jgi:RND superfamily putative drug exporter